MRALALASLALALAACKSDFSNGFAVDVTVKSSALPNDVVASIHTLDLKVSGAEDFSHQYELTNQFTSGGEVRWIYRPAAGTNSELHFEATARSADGSAVAYGSGNQTPRSGSTVTLVIPLGTDVPADNDMGISDGGEPDLLVPNGKANGQACVAGVDRCASGNCVDGFCCDQLCKDACLTCKLPGYEGTCASVPNSQKPSHGSCPFKSPNDPVTPCSYDGNCNGSGSCRVYPKNTACSTASCVANTFTPPSVCDGNGGCVQPNGYPCDPFICNDAVHSCFGPPCADNTTCNAAQGRTCDTVTTHSCGLLDNGRNCTSGNQCTSTNCIDGLCCDTKCTGQCEACDADATQLGKCLPVTGPPHLAAGYRNVCSGTGENNCGGSCDPVRNTADPRGTCWYPPDGTPCTAPSCSNNQLTPARSCLQGSCAAASSMACPSAPSASGVCVGNTCGLACNGTTANCNGMVGDGCEVELMSNDKNCGTCGHDCTVNGQFCQGGACACGSGQKLCGNACTASANCCVPADCGCARDTADDTFCHNRNAAKGVAFSCAGKMVCSPVITFYSPTYNGCEAVCGQNVMCCPSP